MCNCVTKLCEGIFISLLFARLWSAPLSGPDKDVDAAGKFIKQQFESRNMNRGKIIYVHFTTATDTGNIQVVFKVVLETIIRENLEAAQLL